ncbi:MAG: hypothetical protein QM773_10375 [Hyphomonadaceae bacterium]
MFKRLLAIVGFALALVPAAAFAEDTAAPSASAAAPAAPAPAAEPAAAAPAPVAAPAPAAVPTAAATPADVEKRLADLEAYVNNGARVDAATSKVAGAGPGHNAWMMVCAALVLFMTLPGLALFYGGLVRQKNVLSVMAQCLGLAGLVTILWWAFGYTRGSTQPSGCFKRCPSSEKAPAPWLPVRSARLSASRS